MKKRRAETAVLVLVCGSLAGLLIWSKLRLVSDLPRSAYADPKRQTVPDDDGAGSDQADEPGGDAPASEKTPAPGVRDESGN